MWINDLKRNLPTSPRIRSQKIKKNRRYKDGKYETKVRIIENKPKKFNI